MKSLTKKEVLDAIAKTIEVNDDAKIVIRTMAGEVGVGSVKVSSDKKKVILTTHW